MALQTAYRPIRAQYKTKFDGCAFENKRVMGENRV